jgi:quercetin dioxygenase-like cupin family protein
MKYDDLRVVLTALQVNMRIPIHKTDGRISVHVLSGHIRLNAAGRTFDLRPGSLVGLDQGCVHDIEALEESAFLLTIAWPGRAAPKRPRVTDFRRVGGAGSTTGRVELNGPTRGH